jgi:hypothetical protein
MMSEPDSAGRVEVLSGSAEGGLDWAVIAYSGGDELYTLLRVRRGSAVLVAGSGFGGPPLWPGSVLNSWHGRTDDLPYFVMARTAPEVDRVVTTTALGLEIVLALSEPVDEFGLRFAAAALPAGHGPGSLRAERDGRVLESGQQRVPPRPPRP